MKTTGLNFRHLYFFRMVAAEGSVTRAADRLGLAIQTVSTQIAALEQAVGKSLLTQQGRRLVPTEAGRVALTYAEQISWATACRRRWRKSMPARCGWR
jgi:LysR family transcriptional activator of nhaA